MPDEKKPFTPPSGPLTGDNKGLPPVRISNPMPNVQPPKPPPPKSSMVESPAPQSKPSK